jgi:hypothetical protein
MISRDVYYEVKIIAIFIRIENQAKLTSSRISNRK